MRGMLITAPTVWTIMLGLCRVEGLNVTLYSYRDGREESVSVPGDRSPQLFIDAINQITLNVNEPLLFIKPCYKLGCFGLKIWR